MHRLAFLMRWRGVVQSRHGPHSEPMDCLELIAMPIQFQCPRCGKPVQAPDTTIGKKARCPHCGNISRVPAPDGFEPILQPPIVKPAPIATDSPKPARRLPSWVRIPSYSWRFWLVVSALAFVLTIRTPPSSWVLVHYLGLMFAVGLLVARIVQPKFPQWEKRIALAAAFVVAWLWWRTDYYIAFWEKEDDFSRASYTDYIYRGNYRPFYRKLISNVKDVGTEYTEGAMTETGRLHGHWHSTVFSDSGMRSGDDWYWYGERISEGEWHLRNK